MDEELKGILKYLRLGDLAAHWDELLAEAGRGRFSHERLLKHVLEAEYSSKKERARLLRRKRANIPEMLEIETFPFDRQPNLDRKRVMSLYDSFDYMTKKQNTEQGPLSVSGPKFMNWHRGQGGGGAIDLVMHLAGVDFRTAVAWLQQHLAAGPPPTTARTTGSESAAPERPGTLHLPIPDHRMLGRVRQYLTRRRLLEPSLIEPLVQCGRLYADRLGNAVFLLVAGKAQRPVGAELRGTGPRVWRGLVPGTRKDLGYFWIGAHGSQEIVLCESAIDAISCFQLYPQRICISTVGVRADPPWLDGLLARGYELYCGFDTDGPGDAAAARMMALHPTIKRLRPPAHDWNDVLAANR